MLSCVALKRGGDDQQPPSPRKWARTVNGRSIRQVDEQLREVRFDVSRAASLERWDELEEAEDDPADDGRDLTPELRVYATWPAQENSSSKVTRRMWRWPAEQARNGGNIVRLDDIVGSCIAGTPPGMACCRQKSVRVTRMKSQLLAGIVQIDMQKDEHLESDITVGTLGRFRLLA